MVSNSTGRALLKYVQVRILSHHLIFKSMLMLFTILLIAFVIIGLTVIKIDKLIQSKKSCKKKKESENNGSSL
jgi:hypothetical protein